MPRSLVTPYGCRVKSSHVSVITSSNVIGEVSHFYPPLKGFYVEIE